MNINSKDGINFGSRWNDNVSLMKQPRIQILFDGIRYIDCECFVSRWKEKKNDESWSFIDEIAIFTFAVVVQWLLKHVSVCLPFFMKDLSYPCTKHCCFDEYNYSNNSSQHCTLLLNYLFQHNINLTKLLTTTL